MGLIYDLFGNGKTALKVNYGRYAEDPDIAFAQSANPNTTPITNRYAWDGTLPITPELVSTSRLLSTAGQFVPTAIDPDVRNAIVDQYLIGVDQEIAKNFGAVGELGPHESLSYPRDDQSGAANQRICACCGYRSRSRWGQGNSEMTVPGPFTNGLVPAGTDNYSDEP